MNILRNAQDRNGIKWALENWSKRPVTCTAIIGGQMNGYRTTYPQGSTYLRETNDPDKLAAMGEFELKRCGVLDFTANPIRSRYIGVSGRVCLFWGESKTLYSFDVKTFRARLAVLLDLPDNDAEGARRVLWGVASRGVK